MGHTIKSSAKAANTPAYAIISEGWNEQVQEGLTDDLWSAAVQPSDQVLYAVDDKDGEFLGVLTYNVDTVSEDITITLAYVEPSSRQLGIFKSMLSELRTKGGKGKKVLLTVWASNKIGHLVAQKLGFMPGMVEYRRVL